LWRFIGLFAVGLVWAAPLLAVSSANSASGIAAHPAMAARLEAARLPLLLAAPLIAGLGIAITGWLSAGRALVSRRVVVVTAAVSVTLWLVAVVASAVLYPQPSFLVFAAGWYAVGAGGLLLCVVGFAAVVTVLWRRRRWLCALWLSVWGAISSIVVVGSQQSSSSGKDYGAGLIAAVAGGALVLAALLSAALATAVIERNVSRRAHRTSALT
jgi:hypothetical protein